MDSSISVDNVYQHYKGDQYKILGIFTWEATLEPSVMYQSLKTGQIWGRTVQEWTTEVQWPNGEFGPRFRKMVDSTQTDA